MAILFAKYAAVLELAVYRELTPTGPKRQVNTVLLGTWLGGLEESGDFYKIDTAGEGGWVLKTETTDHLHLKVFYVDVGQGDGILLEIGNIRMLIDGGPGKNLFNYLTKWQYKYLLEAGKKAHIDLVVVSHFDADHYDGLTEILMDERFTFGKIWHNGIARFHLTKTKRPDGMDEDLGKTIKQGRKKYLQTSFSSLDDCRALLAAGGLGESFEAFLKAVVSGADGGRVGETRALTHADGAVFSQPMNDQNFAIEALGPVKTTVGGAAVFEWFEDSSKTRNGHSVVLKITYGTATLLFGGDLNSDAEAHLSKHYGAANPFLVDVAKSCHHGSSDFTTEFMARINPLATVISSGDNESYAHPRADAVGCAGRYARGERPKVFSTELARSVDKTGQKTMYGMINLRSDGQKILMAQMKERRSAGSVWDAYAVKE